MQIQKREIETDVKKKKNTRQKDMRYLTWRIFHI